MVYGAALVVGYVLGAEEILPVSVVAGASTPLARVGFALREPRVVAKAGAWAHLRSDIEAVRAVSKPDEREREVRARFVAPGNRLSLLFVGGHPRGPDSLHPSVGH